MKRPSLFVLLLVLTALTGCPGGADAPVESAPRAPQSSAVEPRPAAPERDLDKTPKLELDEVVEKPVVILEEEVEITKDVPKGVGLTNLSNKNLDRTSVVDAYGVGGGAAGAYGRRWGRGSLSAHGSGPIQGGSAKTAGCTEAPPPENTFAEAKGEGLRSTFSIDVDTAAYANLRRFLRRNTLPPAERVRIEELINYFPYDYASPEGAHPFATHVEVAACPWSEGDRLVRIGIKGRELDRQRPPSNLVFLVDVSGSMQTRAKLPLLKQSLRMLVDELGESDRVALVAYAGASGLVLDSTSCNDREAILKAIDGLEAGGSTNGGAGIQLAYDTAIANAIEGGVNRVILATDGDFNVGLQRHADLQEFIGEKAKSGVFLSVLGFGAPSGDARMETIADRGNGNYASIDTLREARKALVEQMDGTLVTIAKDVKIQVEFDPAQVASYRLIGYENRKLANADFANDKKDAGEIGAGHTVTALYQVVPKADAAKDGRLLTLRLRYKQPDGERSTPLEREVHDRATPFEEAGRELRFASAVAAFGMLLRDSEHKGSATYPRVELWVHESQGDDPGGYRAELLELVRKARDLADRQSIRVGAGRG